MARSLDLTSGDTIGIASSDGAEINDLVYGIVRSWVNYDQVAPAITDSYNVDSVTDNSTGNMTANWTNTYADANYCVLTGPYNNQNLTIVDSVATTSVNCISRNNSGTNGDEVLNMIAAIGLE